MTLWFRRNTSASFEEISTNQPTTIKPNKRQIIVLVLKWTATIIICSLIIFFTIFGVDFNPHVIPKGFLAPQRPNPGKLSASCFKSNLESNTKHYGIIPSVPVSEANVCFNYASLIQHNKQYNITTKDIVYHTYWSTQITRELTENQLASIRSFVATQPNDTRLFIWISNSDKERLLKQDSVWYKITSDNVQLKVVEEEELFSGVFEESTIGTIKHQKLNDLVRLASLYQYGGVWFDLDVMFVRDLTPLFHQEWLSQSSCFERSQFASDTTVDSRFSGALMYFHRQSPFVCEMIAAATDDLKGVYQDGVKPLASLGSHLYSRIYYRVLGHRISPWAVLPWCFTEPTQCKGSNSLPDLFGNSNNFDKEKLLTVFTFRWYNKWYSSQGTIFKYLDNQHKQITNW